MNAFALTLAVVLSVALIHCAYVDFRFRHRGSVLWFWLAGPAPLLLWLSRGAIAAALLVALATGFLRLNQTLALVLGVLVLTHIISLAVVEMREKNIAPPPADPE